MIDSAYIHEYGNGKMEPEHEAVKAVLESRGIEVELFTTKILNRRRLDLSPTSLVVGEHPIMLRTFKYLGIDSFDVDCYPSSILPFLKRKTWTSTIRSAIDSVYNGAVEKAFFVKPKTEAKRFTGFVLDSPNKIHLFEGAPKQTQIYCAELVNWIAEYRVFVINGQIKGVEYYEGEDNVKLDMNTVESCIETLEKSSNKTAAYGIDFGVLENGETSLIEWNDGYALGAYGLDVEIYTELLISRWEEIVSSIQNP